MADNANTPDAARFFTTDPAHGALLDRNGDGVPDDLRVRIVALGVPITGEWIELIHLAARLGLETGGLTLPLATRSAAGLPADARALFLLAAGAEETAVAGGAWAVRGAEAVRALWSSGLDGEGGMVWNRAASPWPDGAALDLGQFYETDGALADDDGNLFPERVRLCLVVPRDLPIEVGLALVDLAARLGLETTGLRFPLAVPEGVQRPPATVPLELRLGSEGEAPGTGEGRCEVTTAEAGGEPALLVRGDAASAAAVLRELAATWPHLAAWSASEPTVADLAAEFAATLHGEDAAGRAAILAADLAALAEAGAPPAGELRLLIDEPVVREVAEDAIARHRLPLTVVVAPDDRLVFVDEWADEWEVERARRVVRDRVLPALDPALPAEVLLLVSEPATIRRSLERELAELAWPTGTRVRVLSAFKPGLCWLREEVAPRWVARGDVARVEVFFRPFVAPEGERFLDLPIRHLQELYPGDELLTAALGLPLGAVVFTEDAGTNETYRAIAYDAAGRAVDALFLSPPSYARPYLADFPAEGSVTVRTGAVIVRQGDRIVFDESLPTDCDRFWDHYQGEVLPRVRALIESETGGAVTADKQPFFDALDIEVWCSEEDESLGLREELFSAAEALHQDLYFGTLDAIAALGTDQPTSGTLDGGRGGGALDAPGAVRPFVHVQPGAGLRSRIELRRRLRHLAEIVPADGGERVAVGALPTGPRPRVAVRWAEARAGTPGFTALGLSITDADARTGATVRQLSAASAPVGATIAAEVSLAGRDISLVLPLPSSDLGVIAPTTTPLSLPPTPLNVETMRPLLAQLATLPGVGVRRVARSFEVRALDAIEVIAPGGGAIWSRRKASLHKPTLLVIARHHANEPASTPAALRLAELCATDPTFRPLLDRVNLVLLPLENTDGAALHGAMMQEHPTWKHHAARYNAVGREFARDYFDPDTPWGEARARPRLWSEWLPDVVVDNHGVPSHEWNQIFNGFGSPPRFGVSYWMVSALLYGILHYPTDDPAHAAFAEVVRDRIAGRVEADAEIFATNQVLRDRYERWGHNRLPERFPAAYHRDMLWYFGPQSPERRARSRRPAAYDRLTSADLVTEVADETAQGDYLALVARAHLISNEALLRLLAGLASPVERRVGAGVEGPQLVLSRRRPLMVVTQSDE